MLRREHRCGALVRPYACTTVRRHVPKVNYVFSEVFVLTLRNKSSAPGGGGGTCHLAQAEKNIHASKPFDLLEIVIRMLHMNKIHILITFTLTFRFLLG